jgi:hypothetical protein
VHVGVEKTVLEHLRKEDLHAALAQQLEVRAPGAQRLHVGHRNARDALHGQHIAAGVVPVHLWDVQQLVVLEVAPQLAGVGRLARHVQLVEDHQFVIGHHLHRAQTPPIRVVLRGEPRQREHQRDVLANHLFNIRANHLNHHPLAAVQRGAMHLGHRGGGHWGAVETRE